MNHSIGSAVYNLYIKERMKKCQKRALNVLRTFAAHTGRLVENIKFALAFRENLGDNALAISVSRKK